MVHKIWFNAVKPAVPARMYAALVGRTNRSNWRRGDAKQLNNPTDAALDRCDVCSVRCSKNHPCRGAPASISGKASRRRTCFKTKSRTAPPGSCWPQLPRLSDSRGVSVCLSHSDGPGTGWVPWVREDSQGLGMEPTIPFPSLSGFPKGTCELEPGLDECP